jgi:hypothetical protein
MKASMHIFLICVFLCAGLLKAADSNADPVSYKFEGKVISVDKSLVSYFHRNQTITGVYTFESTTAATATGNPNIVSYPALLNANLVAGKYTATFNPNPSSEGISCCEQIIVGDNVIGAFGAYVGDLYQVLVPLLGPSINGIPPDFISIDLGDTTGATFTSLSLPITAIPLSNFDNNSFQLTFTEVVDPSTYVQHNVVGYITSWQLVQ